MNVSNKIFKLEKDSLWLLLFHHNLTKSRYFADTNEGKKIFNYDGGMYSIIYSLNNRYRINGKFEFLLEYPAEKLYNHWRQSKNPLYQKAYNMQNVTGYEEIEIQMRDCEWGGLFYHGESSLIAGSRDGRYHYAIGCMSDEYNGYIPGRSMSSTVVNLWVKSPTNFVECTLQTKKHRILFHVFIFMCK